MTELMLAKIMLTGSTFPHIRESLPTANVLALMRFLACMSANVDSESTSLDEAFSTSRCHTRIWPLIRVNSVMSLKIRLPVEALFVDD